ncbi:hypothetical protein CEUSTIGMA_g10506.t1 [Chlamydomonas eustigma]|uniref:Uncharacterized protein n=1 Tax=Chlamydomonas eustigma TaxID=1157962 RepID=A0A250XJV1_9CHLO|nr:hypothetical protein CEUSTIGMA_g10506.t1 [Chlamydomonas eustigma]|eukprot:GAX83080.1 hypothetical protein CEUSTIGMA_g10506.t1 [Chlamydomonas eustigma]
MSFRATRQSCHGPALNPTANSRSRTHPGPALNPTANSRSHTHPGTRQQLAAPCLEGVLYKSIHCGVHAMQASQVCMMPIKIPTLRNSAPADLGPEPHLMNIPMRNAVERPLQRASLQS